MSKKASDAGRTMDQQRSYKACEAGTHPKLDSTADVMRVPRIPALGGSTVRSDRIPTRLDASKPVAADHVWDGTAIITAESWVDVDLDLGFTDFRVNGVAAIMIVFFLNRLVCIGMAMPWQNTKKLQTRRQPNGNPLNIFVDIRLNLGEESVAILCSVVQTTDPVTT